MNLFCGKCGTKFPDGTSTCSSCGAVYPNHTEFAEPDTFQSQPVTITEPVLPAGSITAADTAPQTTETAETIVTSGVQADSPVTAVSNREMSGGKKVAFAVLSVLVSLVLFAAVTVIQSAAVARETVKPQAVQAMARTIIDDINIADLPVGGMIDDFGIHVPDFGRCLLTSNAILSEVIYNSLHEYYIDTYGIDESDVRRILDTSELNDFIAGIANQGIKFIMTGEHEDDVIVSTDDIVELVSGNAAIIDNAIEHFRFDANEEYRTILAETLQRSEIDGITWGDVAVSAPQIREIREGFGLFNRFTSVGLIVAAVLAVLLIAALFAMNQRRMSNLLFFVGIPCFLSGAAVTVSGFFTGTALNMIAAETNIPTTPAVESAVEQAFAGVSGSIILAGVITLTSGLIMTGTGIAVAVGRRKSKESKVPDGVAEV
jgi:hypothetical protein